MSAKDVAELLLSDVGAVGLLVLILFTGFRQIWVWGWTYQKLEHERDEWRRIALASKDLAHEAVSMAERSREPFQRDETGRW